MTRSAVPTRSRQQHALLRLRLERHFRFTRDQRLVLKFNALANRVVAPQGEEDDGSEDDADYAPDARGASDAESSSGSDDEGEDDSDDGGGGKQKKRKEPPAPKKQVSKVDVLQ